MVSKRTSDPSHLPALVPRPMSLCVETQGREIMAVLVNDVVADAMRLDLHGDPAAGVEKTNGTRLERGRDRIRNG